MKVVRPYGDTMDDGKVQLSFTLPVPDGAKGREAARKLVLSWGFKDCEVVHSAPLAAEFSFYVAYGKTESSIDYDSVVADEASADASMNMDEVNEYIRRNLGRKVVVVGACTGFDAHTVGIDAIMNMKGFAGNYGLERYPEMDALNMGSQIPCAQLLRTALERDADAILVSQIVTQKNIHVQHLTQLIELLEAEGVRERFVLVVGGPRINNAFAKELGYDAGFGPRTTPLEVASFLAQEVVRRREEA